MLLYILPFLGLHFCLTVCNAMLTVVIDQLIETARAHLQSSSKNSHDHCCTRICPFITHCLLSITLSSCLSPSVVQVSLTLFLPVWSLHQSLVVNYSCRWSIKVEVRVESDSKLKTTFKVSQLILFSLFKHLKGVNLIKKYCRRRTQWPPKHPPAVLNSEFKCYLLLK